MKTNLKTNGTHEVMKRHSGYIALALPGTTMLFVCFHVRSHSLSFVCDIGMGNRLCAAKNKHGRRYRAKWLNPRDDVTEVRSGIILFIFQGFSYSQDICIIQIIVSLNVSSMNR